MGVRGQEHVSSWTNSYKSPSLLIVTVWLVLGLGLGLGLGNDDSVITVSTKSCPTEQLPEVHSHPINILMKWEYQIWYLVLGDPFDNKIHTFTFEFGELQSLVSGGACSHPFRNIDVLRFDSEASYSHSWIWWESLTFWRGKTDTFASVTYCRCCYVHALLLKFQ